MRKLTFLISSTYIISIVIFFGIIFSFNHVNEKLKYEASQAVIATNPELTKKFLVRVKSGDLGADNYVELFKAQFEAERAGAENTYALIDLNNNLKELLASFVILQLLLLTLVLKYYKNLTKF